MAVEQDPQLALQEAPEHQREHQPTDFMRSSACSERDRVTVVDDPPVGQHEQPVGEGGGMRVVGDHHHRLPEVVDGVAQQLEHVVGGFRVEIARRLVGEDHRRARDQRARHRDPLLLAPGELGGRWVRRSRMPTVSTAGRTTRGRACARRSTAAAGCSPRRSSTGSRLKVWKMKPTRSRRSCVSSRSPSFVSSTPPMLTVPQVGRSRPGEDVHQRRLARARGAHDRGEAAGGKVDA